MAKRKKFNWVDPVGKKAYKNICTSSKFRYLLEDVIETPKQAKSFLQAYESVCADAEHNIGYFAGICGDSDLRDDILELFGVDEQVEPRQLLNREYCLSPLVRG